MAQKVKIILEDDINGGTADETVRFGLDGQFYEIDLSARNATRFREAIRPFADKARRVQAGKGAKGKRSVTAQRGKDNAKIRAWAQKNGYEIAERGRIHQHVIDAYYAAQKASSNEK